MKTKVLITGVCGFLGSHLLDYFINNTDYEVVGLDDLSGGTLDNITKDLKTNMRHTFIKGDICDKDLINKIFEEHKPTFVFHLAAYAAEGLSPFIRSYNYNNNLIGSINLINASINYNVKCFVFTSSMGVYGKVNPMVESEMCKPIDPYGISKFAVEMDLKSALSTHGLPYIIFRPHNIYGERQNLNDFYRNVVGIFMRQKKLGEKATIFNDGEQTRSFSYVTDMVPIIGNSINDPKFYNEIFNIGGDISYTINELAEALYMEKEYVGDRFEVKYTTPTHEKLKRVVGNYPTTSLREGLNKMWGWVQSQELKPYKTFDNLEILKNLPNKWKT